MHELERTELPEFHTGDDSRIAQIEQSVAGKKVLDAYHARRSDIGKQRGSVLSMAAESGALMQLATDLFAVPLADFRTRAPLESADPTAPNTKLILKQHEAFYEELSWADPYDQESGRTILFSTAAQNLAKEVEELGRRAQKRPPVEQDIKEQIKIVRSNIGHLQNAVDWYNEKVVGALGFAETARADIEDSEVHNETLDHARSAVESLTPAMELTINEILPQINERIEFIKANVHEYAEGLEKGRNNVDLLTGRKFGGSDGNVQDLWPR